MRRIALLMAVLFFIGLVCFIQSLLVTPELRLPVSVRKLKGQLKVLQRQNPLAQNPGNKTAWQKYRAPTPPTGERRSKTKAPGAPRKDFSEIRLGFYVNWDPASYSSLEKHANQLTHVSPEWMSLRDGTGNFTLEDNEAVGKLAASRGLVLMPILDNLVEGVWQSDAVEGLVNSPPQRHADFIAKLTSALHALKAGGVLIDWEQLDPAYKDGLTQFLKEIADALHGERKQLWLAVPTGDEIRALDLEKLSDIADHFVALIYDENAEDESPGPIASQDWFQGWLQALGDYADPDQWIAAIGAYGYDWTSGAKRAETLSFQDAMSRASYAGAEGIKIKAPDYNPDYSYTDPTGEHTVWFLDAITFLNQLRASREAGVGGVAISRLGTEDPAIWDVLSSGSLSPPSEALLSRMRKLKATPTVTNVGQGEIVSIDESLDDGKREIQVDADGKVCATYTDCPTFPAIYRQGAGGEHEIALTFADGPDPKLTPKILDILKERHVKAAFFIVGRQAEQYPGLVKRIVAEGHEIGNHTYTHANLGETSDEQTRIELNATQRLIESITGRSTTLFRPPYNADSRPTELAELKPLELAQDELGYLIVLENIDPEDWSRPGVDTIVQRVKEQRRQGSIVLLHDAGGNRDQTVKALPKIIDYLETRGDQIVPLSTLLKIPYDELMPPVAGDRQGISRLVSGVGFRIMHAAEEFLWAFMIVATALIIVRTLIVATLAAIHHRKYLATPKPEFTPPLSIIIAAYNEAKVMKATLRSVVDTDYPGEMEVLVIDDGSTDDTSGEVRKAAFVDKRIRLIQQPNLGKSEALRSGLSHAKNDVLVFLDADTHFERGTLAQLVQPLHDPKVGAVSGHAKVGNLRSFIARCQSLEYICGFNLDRRAYSEWNCITVAPGAISAFRKGAIEEAGGFSMDTLAEDTDLTLSLHKCGYHVDYTPDAIAWTEAPETFATLAKQRFRWAFGTLQCLWKHRDLTFNPEYKALGFFSLPSIWFFQIILVAFTPIVDALLILSLIARGGGTIWYYFLIFLLMDLALATLACWMEGEKLRKAAIIFPMRLIYRPLLSWVIWRAIVRAIKGALVTWGKLERTASIPVRA